MQEDRQAGSQDLRVLVGSVVPNLVSLIWYRRRCPVSDVPSKSAHCARPDETDWIERQLLIEGEKKLDVIRRFDNEGFHHGGRPVKICMDPKST